jgi:hypothetical protein
MLVDVHHNQMFQKPFHSNTIRMAVISINFKFVKMHQYL